MMIINLLLFHKVKIMVPRHLLKGYIIGQFFLGLSHRGLLSHSLDWGLVRILRSNVLPNKLVKYLRYIGGLALNLGCCSY